MNTGFPADFGKLLVILGGVLIIVGGLFILSSKFSWLGLGHLPGDIQYKGRNTTFCFPLATCILLSVLVTLIFWLISHFMRR